jgi:predicted PurR-regulated permease PerM
VPRKYGVAASLRAEGMSFDASSFRRTAALAACVAASIFIVVPFWPWIAMSLWMATLLVPLRRRGVPAVVLTVGLVLSFVVPLFLALVPLAIEASLLARSLTDARNPDSILRVLVQDGSLDASHDLLREPSLETLLAQGTFAWSVVHTVGGATSRALAGFLVFCVVAYVRLRRGGEIFAWLRAHLPVNGDVLDRLAAAFDETGRGLFFGLGGAAFAQAALATIAYRVLGVPHAMVFGFLTFLAALVPGLGSGLAWGPIAAGLALTGRPVEAAVMLAIGFLLVGTIDNVLRPWLTRYGKLQLAPSTVFVSMLGGLVVLGPTGILLAPLVVRWTKELLVMARESP